MIKRTVTPIIANSTTIDNQVVFATVFINTLQACGRYYARAGASRGAFSSTFLGAPRGPHPRGLPSAAVYQHQAAWIIDSQRPGRGAAAAAGPACAPVWNVPVRGTPIGPTGI